MYKSGVIGIIGHMVLVRYPRQCSHKCVNNKSEINKSQKDNLQFIITGKNATKSFDAAKKSLNLIALFVQLFIIDRFT